MIIGVVDTGIVPEHPSFSDKPSAGGQEYGPVPQTWRKKDRCQPGEDFLNSDCNKKLIGAQFFNAGFGVDRIAGRDFLSPRDWNGHGSHTASTAGGNTGIQATGDASSLGKISGMAPRARIAAYKVCWEEDEGDGGCNNSDSVAAIDKAVADGVDVINFSISGTTSNYLDAVEVAFLFAGDANVFVASSAGNSGPGNFTVAHISPWVAAVAAGTHSRRGTGTITLGNGATFTGNSLTNAVGPAPLIRSSAAGRAGAPAEAVRLCFNEDVLDPALVSGKILICDRGGNVLVDKAAAAKTAGAAGMILANTSVPASATTTFGILHVLPTIHVVAATGDAIKAYLAANPTGTARFSNTVVTFDNPGAPSVAGFSSRGPSIAGAGDIMKPDFMAPGEDILAAVARPGHNGRDFDVISGTSMSSPHVAGFGALLKQAHPDWSPAAVRSALSTTAHPNSGNLFNVGAGQVDPTKALDPGLVYDAGFNDYLAFLRGQRLISGSPAIDASDLNQPSIAIGGLAGVQTVQRTVTNVGSSAATYNATLTLPAGFTGSVNPSSFTIAPGATQSYTVTFTRTTAPFGCCFFGSLVWSDGPHSVRSPIQLEAAAVAAPTQVTGTGTSGSTSWQIRTGFAGPLGYSERGLIAANTTNATVPDDPTNNFDTADPDGNQGFVRHDFVAPADVTYARWSLFDANTDGADDLDMYVYRVNADSTKTLVAASGGGTSAEESNVSAPAAGATYQVYVHGWQTDGPDAQYTLFAWLLGTADAGNMTATGPSTAVTGGLATINLSWGPLTAGTKYLGSVQYLEGATVRGRTIVRIDG
jgi:subtilisin family serine protease